MILTVMSRWFRTYGFSEVLDGFLVGAYPLDPEDVSMLTRLGVERVMNLVEDEEYSDVDRVGVEDALEAAGIEERRLAMIDYGGLEPENLERAVRELSSWIADGARSYLHCRAGWQRSAAVAAGVVAVREGLEIDEALAYVQRQKPSADPLPHQREDLRRWWESRRQTPS